MRRDGSQAFVKGFPAEDSADTRLTPLCMLLGMKSSAHLMTPGLNSDSSDLENAEPHSFPPRPFSPH